MDAERLAVIEQRIKDLAAELSELKQEVVLAGLSEPRALTSEERERSWAARADMRELANEVGRLT
jgi:hypothetical protein